MDWGYTKPYAVYSAVVDYDDVFIYYWRILRLQAGYAGYWYTGNGAGSCTKDRTFEDYQGVADPAIWQRTGHDGPTIAEIFCDGRRVLD